MQEEGEEADYATSLLGKRKRRGEDEPFFGLSSIPSTTVYVERTFSKAGTEFTKRRKWMFPITLEAIMLLKQNWDLVTHLDIEKFLSIRV